MTSGIKVLGVMQYHFVNEGSLMLYVDMLIMSQAQHRADREWWKTFWPMKRFTETHLSSSNVLHVRTAWNSKWMRGADK